MKTNAALLAAGLLAAWQMPASGEQTNQSFSASQTDLKPSYQALEYRLEPKKEGAPDSGTREITRYGGVWSSESWSVISSRREPLHVLPAATEHKPRLVLWSLRPQ